MRKWKSSQKNLLRTSKNNTQAKSKSFWAVTSSSNKAKSYNSTTAPTTCSIDSTFNGHRYQSISFTNHLHLSHFPDFSKWPNTHTKFIPSRAVAITPITTSFTWTSGPNCTAPSLMMILKFSKKKMLIKNLNCSTNKQSPIMISTESEPWMDRLLLPSGMMLAQRVVKFTSWIWLPTLRNLKTISPPKNLNKFKKSSSPSNTQDSLSTGTPIKSVNWPLVMKREKLQSWPITKTIPLGAH